MNNLPLMMFTTLVIVMTSLLGCSNPSSGSGITGEQVTNFSIAGVKSIGQAPYIVAEKMGYLKELGLNPTVTWMGGGDQVFKALTSKSVDVGLVGLVPFGFVADQFPTLKLISVITDLNDTKLIVRNDRIDSLQDLRGKKIGYSKSTASHILISRLMQNYGYLSGEVTLIPLSPPALATALIQGGIDGYTAREPNIQNAKKTLGTGAVIFSQPENKYEWYFSLFSDDSYTSSHKETIHKLLQALRKASEYIQAYPKESQAIVAEFLMLDQQTVGSIRSDYNFSVRIEPKHLDALKDLFQRVATTQGNQMIMNLDPNTTLYKLP